MLSLRVTNLAEAIGEDGGREGTGFKYDCSDDDAVNCVSEYRDIMWRNVSVEDPEEHLSVCPSVRM
jgi:hypothetical protein